MRHTARTAALELATSEPRLANQQLSIRSRRQGRPIVRKRGGGQFVAHVGIGDSELRRWRYDQISREETPMGLTISSTAFAHNAEIPSLYTCEGKDISPPARLERRAGGDEEPRADRRPWSAPTRPRWKKRCRDTSSPKRFCWARIRSANSCAWRRVGCGRRPFPGRYRASSACTRRVSRDSGPSALRQRALQRNNYGLIPAVA